MSLPNLRCIRGRHFHFPIRLGLLALVLLGVPVLSQGKVIHVPRDYPQIRDAVDMVYDGDEIVVAPGHYLGVQIFKNISLRSTFNGDWSVVRNTVIESVHFSDNFHTQNKDCILRGFTIGYKNIGIGIDGDIIEGVGTHATIEYNIISGNYHALFDFPYGTGYDGAGIANCDGLIQNNIIEDNVSNAGAGLFNCNGTIQNNIIRHNRVFPKVIYQPIRLGSQYYLDRGYGAAFAQCNGTIRNNTLVDNYQQILHFINDFGLTDGWWQPGGLHTCKGLIVNNIFYNTTMTMPVELDHFASPTYCLFRTPLSGVGNLSGDPGFVDPSGGDYHLRPDSLAIDAGKGQTGFPTDPEGRPRGVKSAATNRGDGSGFDIGAYEAPAQPVAVWVPYGNLLSPREGDALPVRWELAPPASAAIRLRLYARGRYLADLGRYDAASGSTRVKLPAPLATRFDYNIMGLSIANSAGISYATTTPIFEILGTQRSAAAPDLWSGLE